MSIWVDVHGVLTASRCPLELQQYYLFEIAHPSLDPNPDFRLTLSSPPSFSLVRLKSICALHKSRSLGYLLSTSGVSLTSGPGSSSRPKLAAFSRAHEPYGLVEMTGSLTTLLIADSAMPRMPKKTKQKDASQGTESSWWSQSTGSSLQANLYLIEAMREKVSTRP